MQFSPDPLNNLENLQAKNKTKSISIYFIVVLVLIGLVCALPYIYIDISSQSRGVVRALQDNVPITSGVNGKITFINALNNQNIKKGDTLYQVSKDNLEVQIANNDSLLEQGFQQLEDYTHLLNNIFCSSKI